MPDPSLPPAQQLEMLANQGGATVPALEAPLPGGGHTHAAAPEAAVTNAPVLPINLLTSAPAKPSAFISNMPSLQRDFSLRSMQSATTADTRFQS